jgi:hypothetical protein
MYQRPDGNYTISYRGTAGHTQPGDIAQNRDAILKGQWTPEMQQAVQFTLLAIRQVARERRIDFVDAARLFTVTGHSQGGFEAEVMSKLYGLPGSSIDGPGAARLIESEGYRKAVAWVRSQEPDANLNGPMPEFWARQYTVTVGGLNSLVDGIRHRPSGIPRMQRSLLRLKPLGIVWILLLLLFVGTAQAQAPKSPAERDKEWRSCPFGQYTGPREGRRNYTLDNYIWVVSPDFAKRHCMPESMVSAELQGASAIAFRMADGADMDRCSVDEKGKHHCMRQSMARFEIYLPRTLNLPAANPNVRFFENRRTTSDWMFDFVDERMTRSQRYAKGQYTPPPGTTHRFGNIYAHPDGGYRFGLWFMPRNKIPWPVGPLWECGFVENVLNGMDMLILENTLGIHFGFAMGHHRENNISPEDPSARYVIAMDKRDEATQDKIDKLIPQDFEHVIYLPHAFAMKVRERAMNSGASNFMNFIEVFRQR